MQDLNDQFERPVVARVRVGRDSEPRPAAAHPRGVGRDAGARRAARRRAAGGAPGAPPRRALPPLARRRRAGRRRQRRGDSLSVFLVAK